MPDLDITHYRLRGNDSLGLPWSAPVSGVSARRLQAGDQLGRDHLDGERPPRLERLAAGDPGRLRIVPVTQLEGDQLGLGPIFVR
jgi:hypothetical protein